MALDDLKETIETLRERIQAHRAYLEGNETRTRQVLIDPMLHKLGWDVGDPNYVELEYRIGRDWADYVLMGSGRPIAVIEAKALGKPLDEKETMQALNYANTAGIPYMTLTNGDHWRMLEVFKQAPIKDRILMNFQLTQDEPYACALQALGLWQPNLASGEPKEAATPVTIEKPARAESASTVSELGEKKKVAESPNNGDWEPLPALKVESGQKAPAFIKFPNSSPISIKSWTDIPANVAEYLIEIDKLSAEMCPIQNKTLYLSRTEPVDLEGKRIRFKRKISNELWLSSSVSRSEFDHKNACWLLEKFDVSPSTVLVSTNRS
ncbi:MAG: hypothetical protein F4Z85_06930 [Gemmatimonadetes bacterium]|nr:hypothetical protein [Gemmatimonadota bacterium]MYB66937.1 hypothetical protein [Gemmatimonadota bacterium]